MSRQRIGLRRPGPGDAAAVRRTGRRRPLWRACASGHRQPWWFSTRTGNSDPGRFDLAAPGGTSYWAVDPAAAIIERAVDPDQDEPPVLTLTALARLTVWRAEHVPSARAKLADLTAASVPGLTAEIATTVPYDLPWAWADALREAGCRGLVYRARFAGDESVALFGPLGVPDGAPAATPAPALGFFDRLPAAFRAGVGDVGALERLEASPPP